MGLCACAFFGRQAHKFHWLDGAYIGFQSFQAAGQKNLVNELIEFLQIALDRGAALLHRIALAHQLQAHANACQRRAQFMRRIGQE